VIFSKILPEITYMNSYKSIIKSASILGGLQIFQIILGVLRTKNIAILMGVYGVGLLGLYTSSICFITGLFSMGLNTSGVKLISEIRNNDKDQESLRSVIFTLHTVMLSLAFLGLFITAVFSKQISYL